MKKLSTIVVTVILGISVLTLTGCSESFQRSMKTFRSEYAGGLERTVRVYSGSGELIETYEGKLDVEANEYGNKVLFDLNGKRVILYNATVIVEEK